MTNDDQTPDWLASLVKGREFAVGDRARVLNRPECFYCREMEHETGLTGTIIRIANPGSREVGADKHVLWLWFDEPHPIEVCQAEFTPHELEPLTADAAGEIGTES